MKLAIGDFVCFGAESHKGSPYKVRGKEVQFKGLKPAESSGRLGGGGPSSATCETPWGSRRGAADYGDHPKAAPRQTGDAVLDWTRCGGGSRRRTTPRG